MNDQHMDAVASTDTPSPTSVKSLKRSTFEWWQVTTTWLTRSAAIATAMGAVIVTVYFLRIVGNQWRIACSSGSEADTTYSGFNIDAKEVITLVDVSTEAQIASTGSKDICQGMWSP